MLSHPAGISRLLCPSELPLTPPQVRLPREVIAAGPPAAPAQLPPPAGSQGSDQQPGFNPLNTSHIDPRPCSVSPRLASPPPTPSRLICTTLISHTANFSIWLLCTQGAQARLVPVHPPSFPRCSCMPWEANRCLAILGFLHLSRASLASLSWGSLAPSPGRQCKVRYLDTMSPCSRVLMGWGDGKAIAASVYPAGLQPQELAIPG